MTTALTHRIATPMLVTISLACSGSINTGTQTAAPAAGSTAAPANALLAPWTGQCGGVPAFDKVMVADFQPAVEAAMAVTGNAVGQA